MSKPKFIEFSNTAHLEIPDTDQFYFYQNTVPHNQELADASISALPFPSPIEGDRVVGSQITLNFIVSNIDNYEQVKTFGDVNPTSKLVIEQSAVIISSFFPDGSYAAIVQATIGCFQAYKNTTLRRTKGHQRKRCYFDNHSDSVFVDGKSYDSLGAQIDPSSPTYGVRVIQNLTSHRRSFLLSDPVDFSSTLYPYYDADFVVDEIVTGKGDVIVSNNSGMPQVPHATTVSSGCRAQGPAYTLRLDAQLMEL
jgi:hypothetical protein